jgi:hypothetical protein
VRAGVHECCVLRYRVRGCVGVEQLAVHTIDNNRAARPRDLL